MMFRELLSIFRSKDLLGQMMGNFARMINLTHEMTLTSGRQFFEEGTSKEERSRIYQQDIEVNKLERVIRKQIITHLSIARNSPDMPYCLLLMSLVKDVERIGDYAKNIIELTDYRPEQWPSDEITGELDSIRQSVTDAFTAATEVFTSLEHDRALVLIRDGRQLAQRSDALIERIAQGDYDPGTTTALVLGTRYYKRIGGHLQNVISSVVMPLHKVDYFDEDEIPQRP